LSYAVELTAGTLGQDWIALSAYLADQLVDSWQMDCDCVLFADQAVIFPGASSGWSDWTSEGPNKWYHSYHYPNIKGPCSTGEYYLDLHVEQLDE